MTESSLRGTTRSAEEDLDNSERMQASMVEETSQISKADTRRVKRKVGAQDDSERNQDRADDMSSLQQEKSTHLGALRSSEKCTNDESKWENIGSSMFAKTFPTASKLVTTSKSGPAITAVYKRIIRSLSTGRIIDACYMGNVSDDILRRPLQPPDNIRVVLMMIGALELHNSCDADISNVYSQPCVAQGKGKLRPWRSLDLTMEDPLGGTPWDMGKREVRSRVRRLVQATKPFLLIGSPPCTASSSTQNLKKYLRDPARFRYFLHEHPRNVTSWHMPEIAKLAATPGVASTW